MVVVIVVVCQCYCRYGCPYCSVSFVGVTVIVQDVVVVRAVVVGVTWGRIRGVVSCCYCGLCYCCYCCVWFPRCPSFHVCVLVLLVGLLLWILVCWVLLLLRLLLSALLLSVL